MMRTTSWTGAALAVIALPIAFLGAPAQGASLPTCEGGRDARPTVWILDVDTGVPDHELDNGCSVNDLLDDESAWTSRGEFVRHVAQVTRELVALDVLLPRERAALTRAAGRSDVGRTAPYETILDETAASFADWAYAGDGGFDRLADGTVRSRVGDEGGFGTLWYTPEEFGDFSLRLQFRDDAPGDLRGNSGVQVRFPALDAPVEGCPTTFNGQEQGNLSWIAVNCGHEVQINDSPEEGSNDPRKTGSIYGFADLGIEQAAPTPKGVWNDLEIRVVGQHYTVIRNGVVINEYENVPGVPFPGRPLDPGSESRGLVGHVGLQAHGSGPDVVSFRDVRVRDLSEG